ncbi:MAG: mechanosensitive ion channel [Pseudomonadales bacterium]|nr:mechanosensitive ion channel [Pseudomonadales bacterium]
MPTFDVSGIVAWGLPVLITVGGTFAVYWLLGKTFSQQPNNRLYKQFSQIVILLVAVVVLLLALPFEVETRGQLLSLFGLVITAIIALSSTTFVSNAMAGLTLKIIGSFRTGDFIEVGEHFGRVRVKTLLHTEIQSEDRDTVTLPNIFVITNPVKVVDQSGTLISAQVSIGYDVHREQVRIQLREAAERVGLRDPFVQILGLGDHAVEYKITGFLDDVSKLVSKKTELKGAMLDTLHEANIEVMSPTVMNQRQISRPLVPAGAPEESGPEPGRVEELMFDKAEIAARIERFHDQIGSIQGEIAELKKSEDDGARLEIAWREQQVKSLRNFVARVDKESDS